MSSATINFLTPLHIDTAERMGLIRLPALDQIRFRRARIARNLLRLSPAAMYNLATQAWLGTDLNGVVDFFEAARHYRRTLINYFYDEDAFSSRQWFASDKGPVNLDDLPRFAYQRASFWINASRALPDLPVIDTTQCCVVLGDLCHFRQAGNLNFKP